jgi:O-antigen/teichoic acid export membrane protein
MRSLIIKFYKRPILKNLAVSSLGAGFAQLCMLINGLLIARILSPDGFGLYTAPYAICTVTDFIFNLGLDTWLLREASISSEPERLVGTALKIKGGFGLVWGILLVAILPLVQPNTYLTTIVILCSIVVLCDGFFTSEVYYLNAKRRFTSGSIFLALSRGGRLLLATILVFTGFQDPQSYVMVRTLATIVTLIGITIYIKPDFSGGINKFTLQIFKASLPYAFSDFLSAIYLSADVSLLAIISGDRKAVGIYSPASGIINALFILPSAAYYVFLPHYTRLRENTFSGIKTFITKMFISVAGLGLSLWLMIGFFAKPVILFILGSSYSTAGDLMIRLSPLLFMKSIEFGCIVIIVANGWQKKRLGPQIASASANIILNIVLIPIFGLWAVANNYLISEVILFIGYLWIAIKCLRVEPSVQEVLKQ